jgi:hypothetical protein
MTSGGTAWPLTNSAAALLSAAAAAAGAVYMLGLNTDQGGNAVSVARSTDGGLTWNQSNVLPAPPGCTFATGEWVLGWEAGCCEQAIAVRADLKLKACTNVPY